MKTKSILGACFCLVLVVSCSAPLLTSGSASIVMELGGVFIPPVHSAVADGSRAFIPGATAAIRVSATDQDGASVFERTIPVSTSTLNVQGMPAGIALNVKVEALDHNDVAICDWNSSEPLILVPGTNSLGITLVPTYSFSSLALSGPIATASTMVTMNGSGWVGFWPLAISAVEGVTAGDEVQIRADLGRAQWVWLGVYDQDWKPLPLVCADQAQGWVVIRWPDTTLVSTINIAVANVINSPGYAYPDPDEIDPNIYVSKAYFAAPGIASGAGTSSQPGNFSTEFSNAQTNGGVLIAAEGSYQIDSTLTINNAVRIYGGFSPDWQSRPGYSSLEAALTMAGGSTMQVISTGTGLIDGLRIVAKAPDDKDSTTQAVDCSSLSPFVINNCILEGPTLSGATEIRTGIGLLLGAGAQPEVANSTIRGANMSGTSNLYSYGIKALGGTAISYIHDCSIDGGWLSSPQAEVSGVFTEAPMVLARCRIWGGSAVNTSGYSSLHTCGVKAEIGNAPGLVLVNSSVSGGYADAPYVNDSNVSSFGVVNYTDVQALVIGSYIDGGSGQRLQQAAAVMTDDAGTMLLHSSIVTVSGRLEAQYTSEFAVGVYTAGVNTSINCDNNVGVGVASYRNNMGENSKFLDDDNSYYQEANDDLPGVSLAKFCGYTPFTGGSFPHSGNAWSAFKPLVRSAYAPYIVGQDNPVTAINLAIVSVWDYPAIMLDLAGKPRPMQDPWQGNWARGAYEP